MQFKGRVIKFGDHIDTDIIIPARYLVTTDPAELGSHCMEGIDPHFAKKVEKGDIIVAGENFGSGSSREHAPLAIKGVGISCVVAKSFARIFFRNAINIGLPLLESEEISSSVVEGDTLEIDLDRGEVKDLAKNLSFKVKPFPPFLQRLIDAGGLLNYARTREQEK